MWKMKVNPCGAFDWEYLGLIVNFKPSTTSFKNLMVNRLEENDGLTVLQISKAAALSYTQVKHFLFELDRLNNSTETWVSCIVEEK